MSTCDKPCIPVSSRSSSKPSSGLVPFINLSHVASFLRKPFASVGTEQTMWHALVTIFTVLIGIMLASPKHIRIHFYKYANSYLARILICAMLLLFATSAAQTMESKLAIIAFSVFHLLLLVQFTRDFPDESIWKRWMTSRNNPPPLPRLTAAGVLSDSLHCRRCRTTPLPLPPPSPWRMTWMIRQSRSPPLGNCTTYRTTLWETCKAR